MPGRHPARDRGSKSASSSDMYRDKVAICLRASEDDWDCGADEKSLGEVQASRSRPVSEIAVNGFKMESKEMENIRHSELTLLEQIGTGCTAEVFKGYWQGKLVAIKEMRLTSSHRVERDIIALKREMGILCKAKHPNLVQLHGAGFESQPWRIVTELCAGGNLFDLLHCSELDPSWAQRHKMTVDIAKGMDFLHNFPPPVIHRDLKSLNLLLAEPVKSREDPVTTKVSDFGLSRMMSEAMTKMTPGAGTLNWMAPEVMKGGYYNEKVDVYSYAMVLFEIICSEIPYDDEDEGSVPRRVVEGGRPDMEALPPSTPRWLVSLMISCWSHLPSERPSFSTILAELQAPSSIVPCDS